VVPGGGRAAWIGDGVVRVVVDQRVHIVVDAVVALRTAELAGALLGRVRRSATTDVGVSRADVEIRPRIAIVVDTVVARGTTGAAALLTVVVRIVTARITDRRVEREVDPAIV